MCRRHRRPNAVVAAATTIVSFPASPLMESLPEPPPSMVSEAESTLPKPLPPEIESLPSPPLMTSMPTSRDGVSPPSPPFSVSLAISAVDLVVPSPGQHVVATIAAEVVPRHSPVIRSNPSRPNNGESRCQQCRESSDATPPLSTSVRLLELQTVPVEDVESRSAASTISCRPSVDRIVARTTVRRICTDAGVEVSLPVPPLSESLPSSPLSVSLPSPPLGISAVVDSAKCPT